VRSREEAAADELLGDGLEIVAEDHHMVAVPPNAAADVKQDLREEHQDRADLVRDGFGRMVVAGVEGVENLARHRVPEIELVRSNRVALAPEAEQLAFDRIQVAARVERLAEHRVK
jgi:hypothetical protein